MAMPSTVAPFAFPPVPGADDGPGVRNMAQRLLFAEPDPAQTVLWIIRRYSQPAVIIHRLAAGVTSALRDPGSIAGPQHRLECSDQAAGRKRPGDGTPLMNMFVRFTVGDREQAAPIEFAPHRNSQPFGRPEGEGGVAETRLLLGSGASLIQAGCKVRQPRPS